MLQLQTESICNNKGVKTLAVRFHALCYVLSTEETNNRTSEQWIMEFRFDF